MSASEPKKKNSLVSSRAGVFLAGFASIVLVPIWIFFIAPQITQIPKDFSFTADIISVDDFFDEERNVYAGGIYSKTAYSYDAVSIKNGDLTIKNVFDVRTPEGSPVFSVERLYDIDRKTGAHVAGGDRERDGFLFAPRRLKKGLPFTYWHVNYDGPARMNFVDSEDLYGLEVYRYETHFEGVRIDQTENLDFLPGVGESRGVELEPHLTVWVEPVTGQLIAYQDDTVAYFYNLETGKRLHPWNHFENSMNERSIEKNATAAKWSKSMAQLVEHYIPILFALLGLLLLGYAGGFLQRIFNKISIDGVGDIFAWVTVVVASVSLIGWMTGIVSLTRIIPDASAMNPVTALCFMVLGFGIFLRVRNVSVSVIAGTLLIVVGCIRILGVAGVIPFDVDLVFFADSILTYDVPARMSEYTALSFILLGGVLVSAKFVLLEKLHLTDTLASIVSLLSLLAISGFLFDALNLLILPIFFSAAIHTALLFFFSSTLLFALSRKEGTLRLGGWAVVSSVLFSLVVLTVVVTGFVEQSLSQEVRLRFSNEVDIATKAIADRLDVYNNALEGGRGLFAASKSVEREEWEAYVDALAIQENYPGIQGMGYSEFVSPSEKGAYIERVRQEGFTDFTIKPEGERGIYTAIIFLEPFDDRNRQAFGFDMFQEPVRRLGMEQARDTGKSRLSGKITLVQETDEDIQAGFLIYVPFYSNGVPSQTLEEKRKNIEGYVYAAFRARNFVEGVLGEGGIPNVGLRIYDGTHIAPETELYTDVDRKTEERAARFTEVRTVYVVGRPWTLVFTSASEFGTTLFARLIPLFSILFGVLISTLVSVVFYTLVSSRQKAIAYAEEVTKDLKKSSDDLKTTLNESNRARSELEALNKVMIGRELKMISLKEQLKKK